jgi:hypothetical protein
MLKIKKIKDVSLHGENKEIFNFAGKEFYTTQCQKRILVRESIIENKEANVYFQVRHKTNIQLLCPSSQEVPSCVVFLSFSPSYIFPK